MKEGKKSRESNSESWIHEWDVMEVRTCSPLCDMLDEAGFFEDLQKLGAWYEDNEGNGAFLIFVRRNLAPTIREQILRVIKKQGLQPQIMRTGEGYAKRRDTGLLCEYKVELDGEVVVIRVC